MKTLLKKLLGHWGYELRRLPSGEVPMPPHAMISGIPDFERVAHGAADIPSMLSRQTAFALYVLCYLQELSGDVVEVGSWQGYSTSFLASAVRDSGNGVLHAIDHFQGNAGKEEHYVVDRPDLADLRNGFERNMRKQGLWDSIRLLDMPNHEAIRHLERVQVRLLFIDGDHSKVGVENDIRMFFPLVRPGGIVVFDDFSSHFPGLVEAVSQLVATHRPQRVFVYQNTLVLKK